MRSYNQPSLQSQRKLSLQLQRKPSLQSQRKLSLKSQRKLEFFQSQLAWLQTWANTQLFKIYFIYIKGADKEKVAPLNDAQIKQLQAKLALDSSYNKLVLYLLEIRNLLQLALYKV